MDQDLRARAARLVDLASTTSGFLVESAWGDLLEAVSGVSRLQLAGVLTRRPPILESVPETGADIAAVLDQYRTDVIATGAQSAFAGTDDLTTRFDGGLAALRALGAINAPTAAPPAPTPTASPVAPPVSPLTATASPTVPAMSPEPAVTPASATPFNPQPTPLAAPPSTYPPATSWDAPASADNEAARKAELTRAATAVNALLYNRGREAVHEHKSKRRHRPLWRAVGLLVGGYVAATVINYAADLSNLYILGAFTVIVLAFTIPERARKMRPFFAAIPGPLFVFTAVYLATEAYTGLVAALATAALLHHVIFLAVAGRRRPQDST